MGKESSSLDINQTLNELERIVEKIEDSNLSLDESLKEFERGVRLVKKAQDTLLLAEQKVSRLLEDEQGEPKTTEFILEEDIGDSE